MIKPGTILQDRYLVGKQIGSGGMGAVYLAIDMRFESQVAIKETFYNDDALSEAFEREARLLNNLHHPVLPHVSDFFTENEVHFLVMEYIEGEDLAEILKTGNPLPAANVLHWANQLLDALDFLHSQNLPIIHRDIKPQNLKITPRGDIILLDFGLAKFESAERQNEHSVFGYSRTYSPLEQIEGTGTDARSDIFSLGATGYHLLAGRPPVGALKRAAAIIDGKGDPLQPVSDFNPEINQSIVHILETALALNPTERYGSALAMRTAIEYALGDDSESAADIIKEPQSDIIQETDKIEGKTYFADFPALIAFAADETKTTIQPQLEPATLINTVSRPVAPFSLTVLDNSSNSTYKKLVPIALLLFVLAGGLIVWAFTSRTNSPDEQTQLSAAQNTQSVPAASEPLGQPEPVPFKENNPATAEAKSNSLRNYDFQESNPVQEQEIILAREDKRNLLSENKAFAVLTKKPVIKSPEKAVKEKVSQVIARTKTAPKYSEQKPLPKQNITSTTVIVIPSSGETRQRVISNRSTTAPRQSSASEINRFLNGEPRPRKKAPKS